MQTSDIREKLHEYVDKSDDKLLELMYVLAKKYQEVDNDNPDITNEEIEELNKRRDSRLNGESKMYNWKEAKALITGQKLKDGV